MKELIFIDDARGMGPDTDEVFKYTQSFFPCLKIKKILLVKALGSKRTVDSLAEKFVGSKMCAGVSPSIVEKEILFEKNRLLDDKNKSFGNLYDGFSYLEAMAPVCGGMKIRRGDAVILFTNQLMATYDEADKRYHLRTAIHSVPLSIISVTGIIEAPAKPREYYLKKQAGIPEHELKAEFAGRFIDYGDKRAITECSKGLVLQAIFYAVTGEPFCENKKCRLFNAHWQEELIASQIKNRQGLCPAHKKILEDAKKDFCKVIRFPS
ncbi:MAG: hypothetical protein KJ967_04475 [Elusimicrobia bacterium]|nr:hypothetical protein [Elusimicrobiota bacterium]